MNEYRRQNTQSNLILGIANTDGAGGISVPLRQQGVITSTATSGWGFLTDGTDGILTCTVEAAAAQNAFVLGGAVGGGSILLTSPSFTSDTQINVLIRAADGTTPINLATTAVQVQIIAAAL